MPVGNYRLANILAHQGDFDEVKEILERIVVNRPDIGTDEDMWTIRDDAINLETALLVGHKQSAELLLNRFRDTGICTTGDTSPMCVLRLMGDAATLLERYDEAREHYKEASRICTEMRYRPELALSRLGLAELLLDHYPSEKAEALEHLDFAINEFREMKMQPSLERALRHKDILKA
jgi:tetratricopeptide (TPR) repeat protein